MFYRLTAPESRETLGFSSLRGRGPIFTHCIGSLSEESRAGYRYALKWRASDSHAHGRSDYTDFAALAEGLREYSFDRLECDPELVVALAAAGFQWEFSRIDEPAEKFG